MFVYINKRSLVGIRDIPSQFGCSVFGQEDHHGTHDTIQIKINHSYFKNVQSIIKHMLLRRLFKINFPRQQKNFKRKPQIELFRH